MKIIKMNLNENKYSEIYNDANVNSKNDNKLIQNSLRNTNFSKNIDSENYFDNHGKIKNEYNFINFESSNVNPKQSILKQSNKLRALNNKTTNDNENNYINENLNKTNLTNLKRVPLGNSEIFNKVLNTNNKSINLNITPDNKKNRFTNFNERKIINDVENNNQIFSFSELQYMDKENNPPILRESSKFKDTKEDTSPLEINIELGISHLNSDQNSQRTLEIPITIDFKYCSDEKENLKNDSVSVLVKEYLIIFNTLSLDLNQIFEFLRISAEKMNNEDKLYSNIFSNETWLKKGDLEYLLNLENKLPFFQNINYLNTEGIIQAIDFCVEISLENNSNIFSVIIINELKDFYPFNSYNAKEGLHKIAKKLKEKRVLMVKNFSINTIILNDSSLNYSCLEDKVKSESEKFKFIGFLKELSNLTLGSNYIVKVLLKLFFNY
jgi:hypothetical protein